MRREKTDQIDVAAIGDLLRRGEGTPYHPAAGIYLQVQQLDRVRLGKVKLAVKVIEHDIPGGLPGEITIRHQHRSVFPFVIQCF